MSVTSLDREIRRVQEIIQTYDNKNKHSHETIGVQVSSVQVSSVQGSRVHSAYTDEDWVSIIEIASS